jgi:hypothetical protein
MYKCSECGLHYEDEQLADECYKFCKEYKACSLKISQQSVEAKKHSKEQKERTDKTK